MTARRSVSRRRFLKEAALGAGALGAPLVIPSRVLGRNGAIPPSEQVRLGVIGCGFRGKYLIGNLPPAARVMSLCDCSLSQIAQTRAPQGAFVPFLSSFRDGDAQACATFQDYRRLLDAGNVDAVMIATPDHHHVRAATLACQAGLDVYLEKPLTLTIAEGRSLVRTVQQTQQVLQVGSQQRSMEMNRFACEFIRQGGLGKISHVELMNYPGPMTPPGFPPQTVPADLDWNQFCGPAPLLHYHPDLWVKDIYNVAGRLWRGWDLFDCFSGHLMTNWGAHHVDLVQWALGRDGTGPVEVWTERPARDIRELAAEFTRTTPPPETSGRENEDERRFWPVTARYADGIEIRFTPDRKETIFYGERGRLFMKRNEFRTDPPDLVSHPPDPRLAEIWKGEGHVARPHIENWLSCIRTRSVPNAPVEAGHRTVTICHLANLARKLNRQLRWDPVQEQFAGDDEANGFLARPAREGFEPPVH